ncbi:hypothetical protein MY4824_001512 [Beauveria thailandica]
MSKLQGLKNIGLYTKRYLRRIKVNKIKGIKNPLK